MDWIAKGFSVFLCEGYNNNLHFICTLWETSSSWGSIITGMGLLMLHHELFLSRVGFSAFPLMKNGFENLEKKKIFENLKILASSVSCCLAACIWLLKVDCSKSTGLVWNFAWFTWNNIQEVLSKESVLNNRKFCGKCSQRVLRCFRGMKEVVSNWRSWVYLIMYKWGWDCHHQPPLTIKTHSWSP